MWAVQVLTDLGYVMFCDKTLHETRIGRQVHCYDEAASHHFPTAEAISYCIPQPGKKLEVKSFLTCCLAVRSILMMDTTFEKKKLLSWP